MCAYVLDACPSTLKWFFLSCWGCALLCPADVLILRTFHRRPDLRFVGNCVTWWLSYWLFDCRLCSVTAALRRRSFGFLDCELIVHTSSSWAEFSPTSSSVANPVSKMKNCFLNHQDFFYFICKLQMCICLVFVTFFPVFFFFFLGS